MIQIGRDIGVQKYGERILIRITSIEKKEIVEGDIRRVKDLMDCAAKELKATGMIHPWNMTISGYDFDPRSLAQIPEVVSWFRKVQERFPYLPIFLSSFTLNPYLVSQLDTEVFKTVKKADLSEKDKKEIDVMAAILDKNEPGLGEKYRKQVEYEVQYKVNLQQVQELNTQISFAAGLYLRSHKLRKPIRKKALKDAFERINTALEHG